MQTCKNRGCTKKSKKKPDAKMVILCHFDALSKRIQQDRFTTSFSRPVEQVHYFSWFSVIFTNRLDTE